MTRDPVRAAVAFLAAPGRAEKILATHRDRGDGCCRACTGHHRVPAPCSTERLARVATARRPTIPVQRLAPAAEGVGMPEPATAVSAPARGGAS